MSQIRVLQIANQAGPLRLFMLPLCRRLQQMGARVELACMPTGPNYPPLAEAGFALHALPSGPWSCPATWTRNYRAIRSLLKANQYDLLIAHTPAMSWIARYAARGLVRAVIYMAHGLPFAPLQNRLAHLALRRMELWAGKFTDGLIVMNQADERACGQLRLTRSGGLCFKVPGVGVDCEQWSHPLEEARRVETLRRLGISPGKPIVAYLGRFLKTKRPLDVIEAARRIGPAAEFVLAGEGPLWNQARQQALSAGPHVHVLDFITDMEPVLKCADVVAFPSVFREGLPRLLLEAQAAGKPVVAYNVRGCNDAIEHNASGLLVEAANVDAFCQAVTKLLNDTPLARQMGQAGQQRARELFSLERAVESQLQAVQAVLQAKNIAFPQ